VTIRVTRRAQRHLDDIADYLSERNPEAAHRVGTRVGEIFKLLVAFPMVGREGALAGTREMVVPGLPYVVVYRLDGDSVVILGVYHGAQSRPGQERPNRR
jgi:toxin ParE1/3/4